MWQRLSEWLTRNPWMVVVALYAMALLLRLFYYSSLGNTLMAHVLLMDEAYYQNEARNLLLGVPQPTDSWFMTPLYPYFLSIVFWFRDSPMAAYLVQMILGAGLAPLIYLVGLKVLRPLAALVCAVGVATFAPLVFFEGLILVESLVAVALTSGLVCALYSRGRWRWSLASGVLLGIAILGRGSNIVLVPIWWAWLWWGASSESSVASSDTTRGAGSLARTRRQACLAHFVGIALTLAPLFLYNATHAKQPLFLTANGGFNLYLGNGPQATGIFQLPRGLDLAQDPLALRYVQRRIQQPVTASEAQRFWMQETVSHVREHPGRAAQLLVWKFVLFWNRTSFPQVEGFETAIVDLPLSRPPFWRSLWILPFALVGVALVFLWRQHPQAAARRFIALTVLGYSIAIALFFITDRYRMAILPLTLVLAMLPLDSLVALWQRHKRLQLLGLIAALAALVYLTAGSRLAIDHTRMRRDIHVHDALRFAKAQRYEAAVVEYRQALQLAPNDADLLDGLARLYARAGEDSLALDQLRGLLRDDPDNARSWYNLGNLYRRLGQQQNAVDAYQRSLEIEPLREAAWNNLGEAYRALGDTVQAESAYRRAVDIVPGHEQAWNNLGGLLAMRGDGRQAEAAFRRAITANPRYVPGWTNLAILLTNDGRYEEAIEAWRTILRIRPDHPLAQNTLRRIEEAGGPSS